MSESKGLSWQARNWTAKIDRDTWNDLSRRFEGVVDTLGVIPAMLELAKGKSEPEKKRYLRAVVHLAYRGREALTLFAHRWSQVQENYARDSQISDLEDFGDLYLDALQTLDSMDPLGAEKSICKHARQAQPSHIPRGDNKDPTPPDS